MWERYQSLLNVSTRNDVTLDQSIAGNERADQEGSTDSFLWIVTCRDQS